MGCCCSSYDDDGVNGDQPQGCFYYFWKYLNMFLLWAFYKEINVQGIHQVPKRGPVIFVSNHSNGIVDAQLLFVKTPRVVHLIGKETLFRIPILGAAARAVGGIPVYRKEDDGGLKQDNSAMCRSTCEALRRGETVALCPEGLSHDEAELQMLKPGCALIAFSALQEILKQRNIHNNNNRIRSDGGEEGPADDATLSIVPVGIVFDKKHKWRTEVLMEFGEPIPVTTDLLNDYENGIEGHGNQGVSRLMSEIEHGLLNVTVSVSDWPTYHLVRLARRILQPKGFELSASEYNALNRNIFSVYTANEANPDINDVKEDLENYNATLAMLGIRDVEVEWGTVPMCYAVFAIIYWIAYFLVLFPLSLPAIIYNFPIILVARFGATCISKQRARRDIARGAAREGYDALDVIASYKIFIALFLTPLVYIAYACVAGYFMNNLFNLSGIVWGVCVFVVLPLFSAFSLLVLDEQRISLRSMRQVCRRTCCCLSLELKELKYERRDIQNRLRILADQLGPPNCRRFWNQQQPDSMTSMFPSRRRETTTVVSDARRERSKLREQKYPVKRTESEISCDYDEHTPILQQSRKDYDGCH